MMLKFYLTLAFCETLKSMAFHRLVNPYPYMGIRAISKELTLDCHITRQVSICTCNNSMSSVHASVQWLKFLDLKKTQKIYLSTVGKMYIVCSILRNAITGDKK